MITQKQWKIQHLAEHARNLSASIAAEAAHRTVQRQPMAADHAVIAEVTKQLSLKMLGAVEKNIFGSLPDEEFVKVIADCSKTSVYLALNAGLLSCKLREHMPLAVFAEELRDCALELLEATGNRQSYADIPAALPRSRIIADMFYICSAVSGKYTWFENAQLVQEILYDGHDYVQGNRLIIKNPWRDIDMPFIKLDNTSNDAVVIIISDALDPKKGYAVSANVNLGSLANSHVGVNKPCKIDIPVRECWAASDGSDIIFPDWEKIASTL